MDINTFAGIRIVPSTGMITQWRTPRSKKSRIRKKWAKNQRNWRPSTNVLYDENRGIVYCHPTIAAAVKAKLKQLPTA